MFWLANLTQGLAEGFELWNSSVLHSISAYVCSYSATAEGFKSPGGTDEYMLTLLAVVWPRVCETLLITVPSSIHVRYFSTHASVSCVNHHSSVGDATIKTSSLTALVLWDFCQPLFQGICITISWFLPDFFFKSRRITEVVFWSLIPDSL